MTALLPIGYVPLWRQSRCRRRAGYASTRPQPRACRGRDRESGARAVELQEEACLSGAVTLGRVPQAKIADLVQALGQDVLEEAANELVALQAAGLPAR